MSDAEAEIQATAALSPVSPRPAHAAVTQAVPVLQDAADAIEAMTSDAIAEEPTTLDITNIPAAESDDVVDDDSFNEAYDAESDAAAAAEENAADAVIPDKEVDDYAKTFDSPIGSQEGEAMTDDVEPSEPLQVPSDIKQASAVTSGTATPTATSSIPQLPLHAQAASTTQSSAQPAEVSASATQDENLDIGQLVADLTAQSTTPSAPNDPTASSEASVPGLTGAIPPPSASSSLPPRPPAPQLTTQTYPNQHHLPPAPGTNKSPTYPNGGSPTQAPGSAAGTSPSQTPTQRHAPRFPSNSAPSSDYQRKWDQFMVDERQYMSEAKWDRFPEGSRIFIGNLSSDKVSKRDVFELFHQYGRLAQISLKPAYGFVQYHTVEEGSRAIEHLQDYEVQGRRIHLEVSKLQDKSKKDRHENSEKGRGGKRGERGERGERGRDDFRSGRNQSPRRNERGRDDGFGRDRGFNDRRRNRSRSPGYGGRHDKDSYRRRSPSPYSRSRNDEEIDLPRRYGPDVPDLQFILQQEVDRNFVSWVEEAFNSKGLKTAVMFLHPSFPKDKVIQRQAAEGVHAVVELNFRAQNSGKIPLQVFDRSAGSGNVRFDMYEDLDPATAAEVTIRAKAATVAAQYHQQQPPPASQYGYVHPGYAPPAAAAPVYAHQQPPAYPAAQPPQPGPNVAELASMMSKMDPASLHQLLSVVQGSTAGQPGAFPGQNNAQPDLNAILGALGTAAPQGPPQHSVYGLPPNGGGAPHSGGADAAQVQNIMSQLARFR